MTDKEYQTNKDIIQSTKEALTKCLRLPSFTKERHDYIAMYVESMEFWNEHRNQTRLDKERAMFVKLCSERIF